MTPRLLTLRQIPHQWEVYLLVLPAVALIGLFSYYPAASGVFHSLFRWNGADVVEWVGLGNYLDLVGSGAFWNSFGVAFVLGFWTIVKMVPALAVAVCIHRCRSERMQYLYRVLFVFPMVIPGLVTVLIWRSFFFETSSGFLNRTIEVTGLFEILCRLDAWLGWGGVFAPGRSASWLGDPRLTLVSCIIWGFPWVGSFAVLAHLAKLQSISRAIYEAAALDGANWWSTFWRIELPMMMGSVYVLFVFEIINTIRDAGTILALVGLEGGPGGVVTVPALFMLREAFVNQNMGYACAVGVVLTLVILLLHKATTVVLEWETLTPVRRARVRAVAIAVALVPLAFGRLAGVSAVVLAFAFPWGWLARRLGWSRLRERLGRGRAAGHAGAGASTAHPIAPWLARGRALLPRALKHAWIWFVLLLAMLPIYLMAAICLKTNQQFYEAPAALTGPYHWRNLSTAWLSVGPTLANSVFICCAATFATLAAALGAAYFFARVRVPGTAFLWNSILILMMLPAIANLIPLFCLLRDLGMLNTFSALILVSAATGQVGAIFVLRNFVSDIPQDLVDAADLDGAGHARQVVTVVLPLAGPIVGTVGVMHFVSEWNNFLLPLIVMRDHERLPVTVEILRMSGEYVKDWGPLMSGYLLASVPVVILFVFTMRLYMRGLLEGGLH